MTAEAKTKNPYELAEKSYNLFQLLAANQGADITVDTAAEALGVPVKSVTGTMTSLAKKGLAYRDAVESEVETEDGKVKKVTTKYFRLTEDGVAAIDLVTLAPEKPARKAKDAE